MSIDSTMTQQLVQLHWPLEWHLQMRMIPGILKSSRMQMDLAVQMLVANINVSDVLHCLAGVAELTSFFAARQRSRPG